MRLLAISDLHLNNPRNLEALEHLSSSKEDWLILAGDVTEYEGSLAHALNFLTPKFKQLIWVPGNHELWTMPGSLQSRGEEKYLSMVDVARKFGALTPEDEYQIFEIENKKYLVVPLFLLYDYSFGPSFESADHAVKWAAETGVVCTDEYLLHPDPYRTRTEWCHARCASTIRRLSEIPKDTRTILINHFPLRSDLAVLPAIPRFSVWCGTSLTESWHKLFNAEVVVSGHLHIPSTQWRDGVRFEEVSLGYPRNWNPNRRIDHYVRQILPAPELQVGVSKWYG